MAVNYYPHVNSPLRIRNTVFQNRIISGPGSPIFSQASENFPCDGWIDYYTELAKTCPGGVISIGGALEGHQDGSDPIQGHVCRIDINDMCAQHRFAEIAECIRANGSIAGFQCLAPMSMVAGYDVSDGVWSEYVEGDGSRPVMGKEAPKELIMDVIRVFGESAALAKTLGFQMVEIHMAYRNMFAGRFLSRCTNKRTDEFGGSLENRAKVPLMICDEIKKRCGEDFLVGVAITANEPKEIYGEDGITYDEVCEFLKLADGKIDILSLRGHQIDLAQGPGFVEEVLPNRQDYKVISKFVRANKLNMKLAYVCGAQYLDDCEDLVASGDADLILSSRGFVSNPDFMVKLREGRPEDIVPCLRCSRCHHDGNDRWASVCAVNPTYAFEERKAHMVSDSHFKRKVAVVGGGCSGMKCAMELADRGHNVTLYEKGSELGGQLILAGTPYVKWPVERFKNYLVTQIKKRDIKVVLNTEITPGMLDDSYDTVIAALGSVPIIPNIPGIENAITYEQALLETDTVVGDVVIVGGGEVALETGLHLVRHGHRAKCIEMQSVLAPETPPVHYRRAYREVVWEKTEGFSWELEARVIAIGADKSATYLQNGEKKTVKADTVVVAVGTRSLYDEAVALAGAQTFRMVGDCQNHGNISTAMRTAYYTAHNL